jgi:hypothetical protein
MASGGDVLFMLCPNAPAVIYGDDYDNINWFDNEPAITKKQFEDGFNKYDAWKAKQDLDKAAERQAILDRIGLTADELKTILG